MPAAKSAAKKRSVRLAAFAKVNLCLHVLGKRPDGYHELRTIFQAISLHDTLELSLIPKAGIELELTDPTLPAGPENLVYRAIEAIGREIGFRGGIRARLEKHIPVARGLGGGSSDAAVALIGMLRLTKKRVPLARLMEIAAGLGADVPFFLNPKPAHVRGIGERCEPLGHIAELFLLIAVPPVEVATASVYRDLRREHWSGLAPPGDISAIIEGRLGREHLVNDLEQVALARFPQIGEAKKLVEAAGARAAAMTGSGSGVFGIFNSSEEAARASQEIRNRAPYVRTFTASALQHSW